MTAAAPFTCLIVEDDAAFADMAGQVVRAEGGTVVHCGDIASACSVSTTRGFDLALLDNHLPDGKGYDFFAMLSRRNPDMPVIMMTGIPDLGEAVALTRNGLFDYLPKPLNVDALSACLRRALQRLRAGSSPASAMEWLGDSPAMVEVIQQLRQIARHATTTVLVTGETGTGKDVAARMLHALTHPSDGAPFVAVNCAALPAEMFESELFGAERGAYTGADRKRQGLVAAAGTGTLFLDEIGEVPLALQAKLLRLLEAREYRPLGSTETLPFQGRFLAATNRSLSEEVRAGRFREDLLYRLEVFSIELPPLRQRRADLARLAERLLADLAVKYERTKQLLQPADLEALEAHDFPGNVRELRNVLERSLLKTPDDSRWLKLDVNWLHRGRPTTAHIAAPPSAAAAVTPPPPQRSLTRLEEQEYRLIQTALAEANGGIRRAAAKVGLSPQALLRRLEKWPELRPPAA
jgi:DNA-binding NtrC family response regulator